MEATFCFLFIAGFCLPGITNFRILFPFSGGKAKEKKNYPLSGLKLNPAGQKKKPRQRQSHVRTSTASDAGMTKLPLRLPRDYDACHRRSSAVAVAGRGVGPSTRTSLDLFNTPTPAPTARCAYNPRGRRFCYSVVHYSSPPPLLVVLACGLGRQAASRGSLTSPARSSAAAA
jgi:hypothetical protein